MIPLRLAIGVCAVAVAAAVSGDLLLRASPWGLNFALWVTFGATLSARFAASARNARFQWMELRPFLPAMLFAVCVAWRDAPQLAGWNVLGTGLALLAATLAASVPSLRAAPLSAYLTEPVRAGLNAALGPLVAAADGVEWGALPIEWRMRRVGRVGIGLLLAVPVGFVFGGLLAAADPVFDRLLHRFLEWDFGLIASHLLVVGILAWLGIGYLLRLTGYGVWRVPGISVLRPPRFGVAELGPPLGLLVLLFTMFVLVQVRYLFGGSTLVEQTTGLSYADYARRGFFELIAVAFLLLPTLLSTEWVLDERAAGARAVRALELALLGLTFVIVASAFVRMRLYVANYGLTVDRVYASSIMIWVVLTLGWLAFTVLRARRERFAFGAMVAGFAVLAVLNALNPERLTVRVNFGRADAGRELDAEYLLRLSADALPSVLEGLASRGIAAPCGALERAGARIDARSAEGWRSWNFARAIARSASRRVDVAWVARCVPGD